KKAPHHRIDLFPVVRSLFASMGLSFNIRVQPGLKFHSEVVLPDNDPLKPSFHQGLAEGL
ncbi:MAG: hypothetical protein WAQ76_08120, partial [Gemmiger qucibialis]